MGEQWLGRNRAGLLKDLGRAVGDDGAARLATLRRALGGGGSMTPEVLRMLLPHMQVGLTMPWAAHVRLGSQVHAGLCCSRAFLYVQLHDGQSMVVFVFMCVLIETAPCVMHISAGGQCAHGRARVRGGSGLDCSPS